VRSEGEDAETEVEKEDDDICQVESVPGLTTFSEQRFRS